LRRRIWAKHFRARVVTSLLITFAQRLLVCEFLASLSLFDLPLLLLLLRLE
jgi:hypothetical protein